jgi:MerR family transcriptional regulator, light-induced transcriptional regulator
VTGAGSHKYRIGTVARLTGVSTHAIRVWERRYRAVEPRRTGGGNRLYSDQDVARLRLMKRLTDQGHAISQIANLDEQSLRSLLPEAAAPPDLGDRERLQGEFLTAVEALDVVAAERILSRMALGLSPRDLVTAVVGSLLEEIGRRWEAGTLRISQEHAASALMRNLLGTLMRMYTQDGNAPTAVAATLPGERHEFGALMAALLAATHGWRVLYLGPDLPVDDLVHAVSTSGAQLLLLSLVNDPTPAQREAARALIAGAGDRVTVLAGGRAAGAFSGALDGAVIAVDLADAESHLRLR